MRRSWEAPILASHRSLRPIPLSGTVSALRAVGWLVTGQLAGLVFAACVLWVRVFYFDDRGIVYFLTYYGDDRPAVPDVPLAVGRHTFGDFVLPYEQALVPNPWTDYPLWPQPYPSGLVSVFKVLTLLPYGAALGLFLICAVAALVLPTFAATRGLPVPVRAGAICLLGIATAPFIAVIDRGNIQGLIVVPLFLFALAWRKRRWRLAACALVAASVLKVYPLVLVVVFLVEGKWKAAFATVAATAAITLGLFALYPGSLPVTLGAFAGALHHFSQPDAVAMVKANYSLTGMLGNAITSVQGMHGSLLAPLRGAPWAPGLAYTLLVVASLYLRRLAFVVRLALAFSLLSQIVPVSYGYSLVFALVVAAELVRMAVAEWRGAPPSELPLPIALSIVTALAITLIPLPIHIRNGLSSVDTLLVPAVWLWLALVCALSPAARERRPEALRLRFPSPVADTPSRRAEASSL